MDLPFHIKRIYKQALDNEPFQEAFEYHIIELVKDTAPKTNFSEQKLKYELQLIAQRAKKQDWGSKQYLKNIIQLIVAIMDGSHSMIQNNPQTMELFPNMEQKYCERSYDFGFISRGEARGYTKKEPLKVVTVPDWVKENRNRDTESNI